MAKSSGGGRFIERSISSSARPSSLAPKSALHALAQLATDVGLGVGQRLGAHGEVWLLPDELRYAAALDADDVGDAYAVRGDLRVALDLAADADLVEVLGLRLVGLDPALGDDDQPTVAVEGLLQRRHRARPADAQPGHDAREEHHVAQRHQRQLGRDVGPVPCSSTLQHARCQASRSLVLALAGPRRTGARGGRDVASPEPRARHQQQPGRTGRPSSPSARRPAAPSAGRACGPRCPPRRGRRRRRRRTASAAAGGRGRTEPRSRCGTIRPTKPIGPATLTTAAVSTEPLTNARTCTAPTSTPRPAAASSPSVSWFMAFASAKQQHQRRQQERQHRADRARSPARRARPSASGPP